MKNKSSLIVTISSTKDIDKIKKTTKYINLDITNCDFFVIKYFIENGEKYLYSESIDGQLGYIYVTHDDFIKAENIINAIYANMPNNLTEIETAKYLYISIAKNVYSDINISSDKNETCNLSLISSTKNLWGSISLGRVTDISIAKIYYYLCKRLGINIELIADYETKEAKNKLIIDNQVLITDLYQDMPYIQANMQTKYFGTYNDDLELDKKIKYIKNKYNNYYLDKILKNIDYTNEECIKEVLYKTQNIIDIDHIKPVELSIIYNLIFNKYCPNYQIKINNLYLNNKDKYHFILISLENNHYSYNYKERTFVKVTNHDILNNLKLGKIGLYQNELIPNIDNIMNY